MDNELVDVWTGACIDLYSLLYKHRRYDKIGEVTLWDAFVYLYLKKVTPVDGRPPKGVFNVAD